MAETIWDQATDPFRVGLIVALVVTQVRTQAVTGRWLPLAAGVLFVAVIVPTTLGAGDPAPLGARVGLGIVVNLAILAVVLAAREAFLRLRR